MPLTAVMVAGTLMGRWRISIVFALWVMLCQETACAVTLGWGVYLILFSQRRGIGAALLIGSIVWVLLCVELFIPFFAAEGRYERFDLYGALGSAHCGTIAPPSRSPGEGLGLYRTRSRS